MSLAQTEAPSLQLTFLVKCVGDECTALCLELDIASCGKTRDDAIESLTGLVELNIQDCSEAVEEPIPLRLVPPEALREFLPPPQERAELSLTSLRVSCQCADQSSSR